MGTAATTLSPDTAALRFTRKATLAAPLAHRYPNDLYPWAFWRRSIESI